jgi:uncharacterized SAM-binding protein YcdF (DUF218 family)
MRRIGKIVIGVVGFFLAVFVVSLSLVIGFAKFQKLPNTADAGIILGAAINSPALYNRSLQGLKLYEEGKVKVLVLSGGRISDKDISEASYIQKVILKNADAKFLAIYAKSGATTPLILEESSRNTYENIRNSKVKIPKAKSVVVVSDEYHLARASFLAWRAGFEKVYWTSPNSFFYPRGELYFHYVREAVALIFYIPKFILG